MTRIALAALLLLYILVGPAIAAPNVLPLGGTIAGTCSASGVTAPFTALPATAGNNGFFGLDVDFKPQSTTATAVGSITLTRSTDGGATFGPILGNSQNLGQLSATGGLLIQQYDASQQFRLECVITSGLIGYTVGAYPPSGQTASLSTVGRLLATYARSASGLVIGYNGGLSQAQIQMLYDTKYTSLSASDLANMTTGYTTAGFTIFNPDGSHTPSSAFVTLSFPAGSTRSFSGGYQRGGFRTLLTTAATVTAIVDGNGNAIPAAFGSNPFQYYTVGATVTQDGAGFGANVPFYPTMREAVDSGIYLRPNVDGPNPGRYPPILPNAAALGL